MLQGSIARHGSSGISHYLRANANLIQRKDLIYRDRTREIKKLLRRGEEIIATALQPRMLPGGSYLVPNIIYATNERIIVYDPYASDFNGGKVSIPYNTVVGVKLEKRPYATMAVKIETSPSGSVSGLGMIHGIVGGEDRFERSIEALPITKAEELMDAILRAISKNSIRMRLTE